jgi:hypothetical protein
MLKMILVKPFAEVNIVDVVDFLATHTGKPLSKTEIRRRIKDGAVYVNNEKKTDYTEDIVVGDESIAVRWGKRGNYEMIAPSPWEKKSIQVNEVAEDGSFICSAENLILALCGEEPEDDE